VFHNPGDPALSAFNLFVIGAISAPGRGQTGKKEAAPKGGFRCLGFGCGFRRR
jgi:hypothetical protein